MTKLSYYIYAGLPLYDQNQYRKSLFTSNDEFMPEIIKQVFQYYGVNEVLAYGSSHAAYIVKPRYVAMYYIRERLKVPLKSIGNIFGGRDHSTVIHGITSVKNGMAYNKSYRAEVLEIGKLL